MSISAALYRKMEHLDPALRDVLLSLVEEVEQSRKESVTKDEFRELIACTGQLAEAQKSAEVRLGRLETTVQELAEAQKRTELKVEELAEAQKRTELKVEELAEAQKRTELKVEELAEAERRTEARLAELARAQQKTEEALADLVGEHRKTRKQLGGLAATVGYRLEDEAFKALPLLLQRDHGLRVEGRLKRQFVADKSGHKLEVNIFGQAAALDRTVTIVGEAKSQLSKNGIDEFIRKKLMRLSDVFPEIFPLLVAYMIAEPDAEDYAKEKGITLYYSYDF